MSGLDALVTERDVLLCCGSGGVGKTTVAAALALAGAMLGRRVCVLTVDPARRLADALGASGFSNSPHHVDAGFSGTLDAVMLDASKTFDELVTRHAKDEAQVERILANRLYRNVSSSLSGTQEYMAAEKLFELYESKDFDLLVIDTPPTRSALDFLEAPKRLADFIDNRLFRLLLAPSNSYLRAASVVSRAVLRTITKVAGSDVVDDTLAFFQAFDGMEDGFKTRAASVEALLADRRTGFVFIAAPRHDCVGDLRYFSEHLTSSNQSVDALVVNRIFPDFGPPMDQETRGAGHSAWRELVDNLNELSAMRAAQEGHLHDLGAAVEGALVAEVPMLVDEVHDIDGLTRVARATSLTASYRYKVPKVLIVSDARTIIDEIRAVVDDGTNEIVELSSGEFVRAQVSNDLPDIVITDCQIQNMGGIAVCLDIKLEESGGRIPFVPVLVLLDRRADVFLAKRSGAEGYLVKPLDPIRIRRAVEALLADETFHDPSFAPVTLAPTN